MNHQSNYERIQSARCNPLGEADIPDIGELYMRHWLNCDKLGLLLDGHLEEFSAVTGGGSFVARYSDYEEGALRRVLRTTAALRRLPRHEWFTKETVSGATLRDGGTNELLAAAIFTVPPRVVEGDPEYRHRQEAFFRHGATGGEMTFRDPTAQSRLKAWAMSGQLGVLWLILGRADVRGAARYAVARGLIDVLATRNDLAAIRAYYLAGLSVRVDGVYQDRLPPSLGWNCACATLNDRLDLKPFATEVTLRDIPGCQPEPKATHMIEGKKVELFPVWSHVIGETQSVLARCLAESPVTVRPC